MGKTLQAHYFLQFTDPVFIDYGNFVHSYFCLPVYKQLISLSLKFILVEIHINKHIRIYKHKIGFFLLITLERCKSSAPISLDSPILSMQNMALVQKTKKFYLTCQLVYC